MKRCLCAVFIFLFTVGCQNNAQPDMKPFSLITYFDGPERYAGLAGTTFAKAADFLKKDITWCLQTRLFWNADGQVGGLDSPHGWSTWGIEWSPSLKAYVVLTSDGIYTVRPGDKNLKAIWPRKGLSPRWVFDRDKKNLLVEGLGGDQNKFFCAIVDLATSKATVYYIDSYVTGMAFTDANTAAVSLPSAMVMARRDEAGTWTFGPPDAKKPPGEIVGAVETVPVFRERDTITVGEHTVRFAAGLSIVKVVNGRIFAVTPYMEVYRVNTDWTPVKLGTISLRRAIGYGAFSEGFWLAMSVDSKTVTVYTYGDSEQSVTIQVP